MSVDFFIPKLGDNVDKVTIVSWLVADGAAVKAGDDLVEVETDKAVVPVPAPAPGVVRLGPHKAGDVVTVLAVLATIEGGEAAPASAQTEDETPAGAAPRNGSQAENAAPAAAADLPKATPVAQKIAEELGLDLRQISGPGQHDRITKEDVLQAAAPTPAPAALPQPISSPLAQPSPQPIPQPAPTAEVINTIPLKGIKGIVARRMAESVHTTARVTMVTEVDATEFVALRERLKAKYNQAWGFAPGYNDLLVLVLADALRKFAFMNARMSAAGDAIEHMAAINIGVAVDTDRGLVVPVLKDVDQKGLQEIGAEFRALVERARNGKNSREDLTGGTFTISNLGMYRVDAFTPVINMPEAAILGVGRITPKPVARGEEIVIRKMWSLSLVFDHRLIDGAPAARFLDYICEVIEEPYMLFLTKR
jgi:pyruvate dehydrogenase E2 component (dihydrolipoamide acetyltransferase)